MKLKTKLALLVVIFTLAFGAFWALSYATSEAVKVNGPAYHQIVDGKDLIADILPPPEYIIESFLTARQISDSNYRGQLPALIAKMRQLQRDYNVRHAFWIKQLPNETDEDRTLRTLMLETSYEPAIRFFNTVQGRLIPLVQKGDYAATKTLIYGPLQSDYNVHRAAIDEIVKMSNARNARIEGEVADTIRNRQRAQTLIGLAII